MKRILAPLLIGLIGAAILIWLGSWQMQRLEWKRGVLYTIERTIAGAPAPLPRLVDPTKQKYQPVELTGQIGENHLFVLVSVKRQGAGWRVISDFTTNDGRRILLDRGFTPVDKKAATSPEGVITVTGNLHWPDDRNSSTPDNDWIDNVWFARDISQMSDGLKTEPLLVVAREITPRDRAITPMPVSIDGIPNDHLQYAITWFSLAGIWLLMTGLWLRRLLKGESQ